MNCITFLDLDRTQSELEAAQQEAQERRLLLEEQKLHKLAGSSATP